MSKLFGILTNETEHRSTRRAHHVLETTAASFQGAVVTTLKVQSDGTVMALVRLTRWDGNGVDHILYDGAVCGMVPHPDSLIMEE